MRGARVLIAGTGSGCGKTSAACGLMAALAGRGLAVSACKSGPDYIDPMFHREVAGAPSRNLDLFLCGEEAVRGLLAQSCREGEVTVIEGAMGFYDGLGGGIQASACHLAEVTRTPVILVADAGGKALSLAAELQGFARFRPNKLGGFLLNRCSPGAYPMLKELVEEHTGLPVLGYLPRMPKARLQSRHLGLVAAAEVPNLKKKLGAMAAQMEKTVDLDGVLALAGSAPPLESPLPKVSPVAQVRIGVARDRAFSFLYRDNLELLQRLGARPVFFSPLADSALPPDIQGLWLPGGYPELYAGALAANAGMLSALRRAVEGGLPTIAEGGGFLLLCRELITGDGVRHPMAGAVTASARMGERLAGLGYLTLTAKGDNLLAPAGESLRAHRFHYAQVDHPGDGFRGEKGGRAWEMVHGSKTLFAGLPHLHFWGCPQAARRFVALCGKGKLC